MINAVFNLKFLKNDNFNYNLISEYKVLSSTWLEINDFKAIRFLIGNSSWNHFYSTSCPVRSSVLWKKRVIHFSITDNKYQKVLRQFSWTFVLRFRNLVNYHTFDDRLFCFCRDHVAEYSALLSSMHQYKSIISFLGIRLSFVHNQPAIHIDGRWNDHFWFSCNLNLELWPCMFEVWNSTFVS